MTDISELNHADALDEFRLACAERRFIMERFVQAVTIYLALSGFAFGELVKAPARNFLLLMELGFLSLLPIALYAANHFRAMYAHTARREYEMPDRLGFQRLYDLTWGYRGAILVVAISQTVAMTIVVVRAASLH
jgi:hypothetical protein